MSTLLGYLAEGLKYLMIFCDKIAGQNYWLSLFLFALIIKLVLFPFGIKQQKSQQKLAKLRPKEEAIRRKYKGRTDQDSMRKMNEEIQLMYREEKYSQFGGCLPMLLQMPILFSLYYIIQNPLHYTCQFGKAQIEVIMETFNRLTNYTSASSYQNLTIKATSFLQSGSGLRQLIDALPVDGTVPNGAVDAAGKAFSSYADFRADLVTQLSSKSYPNFKMFGFMDLSVTPRDQIWWYILIPIVVFAILWGTAKLQKKFTYQPVTAEMQQNNSTMKMMEYLMPITSAVLSFSLPAALALYWIYQNVLGFGQQVILSKMFPTPKMTDAEVKEALREADRQAYEARKAEEKKKKSIHDEDRAMMESKSKNGGVPEGWVEPMGPVKKDQTKSSAPTGKKSRIIGKADIKNDKKEDK